MDREAATFAATNHCSGGVGIGNGGRRWEVAAKMPMSDGEVASGGGASGGVKVRSVGDELGHGLVSCIDFSVPVKLRACCVCHAQGHSSDRRAMVLRFLAKRAV